MPSLPIPLTATNERLVVALNAAAGRPLAGSASYPTDAECSELRELVNRQLGSRTTWEQAAGLATKLAAVLPAAKADGLDRAVAMKELAKAFADQPPAVALFTCDHMLATCRFRPVPAEVRAVAAARRAVLAVAAGVAERVMEARARARREREQRDEEAREEAAAIAEGRETPAERRKRVADEVRALMRAVSTNAAA